MKRNENDKAYAIGYAIFGLVLIFFVGIQSRWDVILAMGFWGLVLVEYLGGEDNDRNYLFMILFAILPFGILGGTGYEYWVLVFAFLVWGAYEIVEERKIDPTRWDLIGAVSLIIGAVLILAGVMGNTYPDLLGQTFGVMFVLQGLKEWFD